MKVKFSHPLFGPLIALKNEIEVYGLEFNVILRQSSQIHFWDRVVSVQYETDQKRNRILLCWHYAVLQGTRIVFIRYGREKDMG
jgi:hypothetical protein